MVDMKISIKFDDAIFIHSEKIKAPRESRNKIGFYKEANHYVFSSSSLTNRPLITDISKIMTILNTHTLSEDVLKGYDLNKTGKTLRFLSEIHTLVNKRNAKIQKVREKKFFKFLLAIPLISLIAKWCLKDIVDTFKCSKALFLNAARQVFHQCKIPLSDNIHGYISKISQFSVVNEGMKYLKKLHKVNRLQQSQIVEKYLTLTSSTDLENQRDKLLEMIKQVKQDYQADFVKDPKEWNDAEIWSEAELKVKDAFSNRIAKEMESLKDQVPVPIEIPQNIPVQLIQEAHADIAPFKQHEVLPVPQTQEMAPQLNRDTPEMIRLQRILAAENESGERFFAEVLGIHLTATFEAAEMAFENIKAFLKNYQEIRHIDQETFKKEGFKGRCILLNAYTRWLNSKFDSLTVRNIMGEYFNKNAYADIVSAEKELQNWISKVAQINTLLHANGTEMGSINAFKSKVRIAFHESIRVIYPSLEEAERIINLSKNPTVGVHERILEVGVNPTLEKVVEKSKEELPIPVGLPEDLINTIKEGKRIKVAMPAYWLATRLNNILSAGNVKLSSLFETENQAEFFKKYKYIVSIMQPYYSTPYIKNSLDKLTNLYETKLKAVFLKENRNGYTFLFPPELTYKQLIEKKNEYVLAVEEFENFQLLAINTFKGRSYNPHFYSHGLSSIDAYLAAEVCRRIPSYKLASEFWPTPKIREEFKRKLNIYKLDEAELQKEGVPEYVKERIKEGLERLNNENLNYERTGFINRLQGLQRSRWFSGWTSLFTNTHKGMKALFCNGLQDIKTLLGVEGDSSIEEVYTKVLKIFQGEMLAFGNVEKPRYYAAILENAYTTYLNFLVLKPLLLQVFENHKKGVQELLIHSPDGSLTEEKISSIIKAIDSTIEGMKQTDATTKSFVELLQRLKKIVVDEWKPHIDKDDVQSDLCVISLSN